MNDICHVKEAISTHNGIAFHSKFCPGYYVIEQNEDDKIDMKIVLDTELEQSKMRKVYAGIPKHHILFVALNLSIFLLFYIK